MIIEHISQLTLTSLNDFVGQVHAYAINFLAMDIKIVFGVIFCSIVITYDIYLFYRWFTSFKFTTRKKCTVCQKSLIRERRHLGDRILGVIIPLKRYRCIGCADEYLIVSPDKHKHAESLTSEHATITVHSNSQSK